jgi:hypothetical protein
MHFDLRWSRAGGLYHRLASGCGCARLGSDGPDGRPLCSPSAPYADCRPTVQASRDQIGPGRGDYSLVRTTGSQRGWVAKDSRGGGTHASKSPVYAVRVWLFRESKGDVMGATEPPARDPTARRAVLVPGDPLRYPVPVGNSAPEDRPPVAATFRDANGLAWFRPFMGGLVQLDAESSNPLP